LGCPSRISGALRAWQAEWAPLREQAERQAAAAISAALALIALRDYSAAYRRNLNSHPDGMTAVAILKLLDHLRDSTGLIIETADVDDIFDLIPAVRIAARAALADGNDAAGAHATLGELRLISGDQTSPGDREQALADYTAASSSPAIRDALIERLDLFYALGFRPALVLAAMHAIKPGRGNRPE